MAKGINSTLDEGQTPIVVGGGFDDATYGFYANEGSHGMGDNREISPSLKIGSGTCAVPPAIAFHPTQDPISSVEQTHALSCGSKSGNASVAALVPEVAGILGGGSGQRGWSNDLDRSGAFIPIHAPTLTAANDPSRSPQSSEVTQQVSAVHQASAVVRRLTPTECERLQGFPDGHTAWGIDKAGKRVEMADSSRYRQLGNAVTVNVAERIARRLVSVYADAEVSHVEGNGQEHRGEGAEGAP